MIAASKRKNLPIVCILSFMAVLFSFAGSAYSLTNNWGTWLGGDETDFGLDVAVSGNEIYVSGMSESELSWESVPFHGNFSVGFEIFVVEIENGTLNWGQWLGGSSWDYGSEISVEGNEIYVAGLTYSNDFAGPATMGGAFSGTYDGYLVNIEDTPAGPEVRWGTYLGGTGLDYAMAVAVNGNEVYVGGSATAGFEYEANFENSPIGNATGYLMEFRDNGASHSFIWGLWLGGPVFNIAVNNNEIYAVGLRQNTTGWSGITLSGTHLENGAQDSEGFVVEISDDDSASPHPSFSWGTWLGGSGRDEAMAVAVTGDEVFVGGQGKSTSWDDGVSFQGTHVGAPYSENYIIKIIDTAGGFNFAWGQWIGPGGGQMTGLQEIALDGDDIYIVGASQYPVWDEIIPDGQFTGSYVFQGITSYFSEGFAMHLIDGAASPTFDWATFLGGVGNDYTHAVCVSGAEVIISGFTESGAFVWDDGITLDNTAAGAREAFVLGLPHVGVQQEDESLILSPLF